MKRGLLNGPIMPFSDLRRGAFTRGRRLTITSKTPPH
jgi:hypothetical protein